MRGITRDECHAAELGSHKRPTMIGGGAQGRVELHNILSRCRRVPLDTGDTVVGCWERSWQPTNHDVDA